MRIGVFSDTHDRLPLIDAALAEFARLGAEALLHAGDVVSPFAARRLLSWKGPLHVTYGNNDGERAGLSHILPQIRDGPVRLELGGRRILLHHYLGWCEPVDLQTAEIVITGHTHEVVHEARDGKLFVNPGECCGWVTGRCTIAIIDTQGPSARVIELTP